MFGKYAERELMVQNTVNKKKLPWLKAVNNLFSSRVKEVGELERFVNEICEGEIGIGPMFS